MTVQFHNHGVDIDLSVHCEFWTLSSLLILIQKLITCQGFWHQASLLLPPLLDNPHHRTFTSEGQV